MKKPIFLLSLLFAVAIHIFSQTLTIDVGGVEREYILHVPDNLPPGEDVPVVIALHFLGCTASSFEVLTQFSDKADMEGFIAVYPQGISNSWNAGGCCDPAASSGVDDIGFISALIDTLIEEQPVDPEKVFIVGFSNGGIMAYTLASEISDKIAGIAPVGALFMMEENHAANPVPIIHCHALDDASVDINGQWGWLSVADLLDEWKTINGITAEPDTFRDDSRIKGILYPSPDSSANIILYLTETGGHSYTLSSRLGTTNRIWEFFTTQINRAPVPYDTIVEGPRLRDFKIHIPSGYYTAIDTSVKYPLILAAHGWNQNPESMALYTGFNSLANRNDFFVSYLHYVGPPPDLSWNYFMDEEKPDDIGYAKAVIDTLFARFPLDSAKIYAVGFSDGCGLANRLPFETDGLVSATGTVGGMIEFDEEVSTTPVRMIHFHAKNDPSVNYSNVRDNVLNYWLEVNGCSGDPEILVDEQEYLGELWKNAEEENMIIFYSLPLNMHTWPVNGEYNMLLSASDLMWEFFSTGTAVANIPHVSSLNERTADRAVTVYPSPAKDKLSVKLGLNIEDVSGIQILDLKGNIYRVFSDNLSFGANNTLELDIADLPAGLYILRIQGVKSMYQEKFLVLN